MNIEQALFYLEIKKKSGSSINPDIHQSKAPSSDRLSNLRLLDSNKPTNKQSLCILYILAQEPTFPWKLSFFLQNPPSQLKTLIQATTFPPVLPSFPIVGPGELVQGFMSYEWTYNQKNRDYYFIYVQGPSRHSLILTLNCCSFIKYFFLDFEKSKVLFGNFFQFWPSINLTVIMWGPKKICLIGSAVLTFIFWLQTNTNPPRQAK